MDGFYVYLSSDANEDLFPYNTKANFTVRLYDIIDLNPQYEWFVALTEVIFPSDSAKAVDKTVATAGPIYVYLDLLRPSRVGNSSSPLLRIVSETKAHQTFPDRYYVPVVNARIDRVTALLTDRTSAKYPFRSGKIPTILVLHFSFRRGDKAI